MLTVFSICFQTRDNKRRVEQKNAVSGLQANLFGACKLCEEFHLAVVPPAVKRIVNAPPPAPRQGPSLVVIYSLILVLGALKVCMVLLNGVEDHIADAAGVTAAQSWRDRDTGSKVTVRTFSVHPRCRCRKQQQLRQKCFQ